MKRLITHFQHSLLIVILSLLSINGTAQNSELTPLGYWNNLYLGMSLSDFEKLYDAEIKTVDSFYDSGSSYRIEASKCKIPINEVELDLQALNKTLKFNELEFTHSKLYFLNKQLVEIYFEDDGGFVPEKDFEDTRNQLKFKYMSEYETFTQDDPDTDEGNYSGRLILYSQYHDDYSNLQEGNSATMRYRIEGKRNATYDINSNSVKLMDHDAISRWTLFLKYQEELEAQGLNSISTFREMNLEMSLDYFKDEYAGELSAYELNQSEWLNSNYKDNYGKYVEAYTLSSDRLSLLGHPLKGIYYFFFEDKLMDMYVVFDQTVTFDTAEEFNTVAEGLKVAYGDDANILNEPNFPVNQWEILFFSSDSNPLSSIMSFFTISTGQISHSCLRFSNTDLYMKMVDAAEAEQNEQIRNDF